MRVRARVTVTERERERERESWAGVLSRPGTSPPTMARQSICWQWLRRLWDSGSTRLPGRFLSLASWSGHFGIATCWSSWFRVAFGHKIGYLDSGAGKTIAASSATMVQALCSTAAKSGLPCRQSGTCKCRWRCDRRHVLLSRNTRNSSQTAVSLIYPQICQQVHSSSHAQFCGATAPLTGTFSRTVLLRAVALCDEQARVWWRSTMRRTSNQRPSGQCRATCCLGRLRAGWRGLRRCRGRHHHHGPADAAHRLRKYRRDNHRADGQGLGSRGPPAHMSGAGFLAPTTRSGQSRSRATPHSAKWKLGALPTLSKGETISQMSLQRREQTHTNLPFGLPKHSLLVPPWPSKRRGGQQRPTSCSGSGAGTTRRRLRQDQGRDRQEQGQSASDARWRRCQPQVRHPIGLLPSFPRASRKTVTSTHARSEGTACSWGESVGPSHHLLSQMWSSVPGRGGRAVPQLPRECLARVSDCRVIKHKVRE